FVPLIVTVVPTGPEVGVNPVMVMLAWPEVTVKSCVLVALWYWFETVIGPELAPLGTVNEIVPSALIVTAHPVTALQPLEYTTVPGTVRFGPLMVTVVPIGPEVGVNPVMVGTGPDEVNWSSGQSGLAP